MKGIIALGGISWTYRWQRPQQILTRMKDHYRCVYVDPCLGHETITKIKDDLYLARIDGGGIARQMCQVNSKAVADALRSMTGKLGIDQPILLFDFPYWSPILEYFTPYRIVYNCMDAYRGFSDLAIHRNHIDYCENLLFDKADLVIATSKGLENKAKSRAKNVKLVPNACDFEHFDIYDIPRPPELPYGNVAGYVGAIAEWFDQKAIAYAADNLPYWNFVLLGNSSVNIDMLKNRKNILLLGEQPYSKIPHYISYFDVALIPFNVDMEVVKDCNPVKAFEYLASGKAIVSSALPEIMDMRKNGKDIEVAIEAEDWSEKILTAYAKSSEPDFSFKQKMSVRRDTWDNRVADILNFMKEIDC